MLSLQNTICSRTCEKRILRGHTGLLVRLSALRGIHGVVKMVEYTGFIEKRVVDGGILIWYHDLVCGCGEKLGMGITVKPTNAVFGCPACHRELGVDVIVQTGGNTEI